MASNSDVVKKNYTITCLYYVSISVCVCLLQTISKPDLQNSHNFSRRQQSLRMVELVDHTMTVDVWLDAHTRPSTAML